VIVPMVLVLNILNSLGTDGSFGNENSQKSLLAAVGVQIAPAFSPFGLNSENWPAAVGIFTGVLAKEAIVGTLNAAYAAMADAAPTASETPVFAFRESMLAALKTIPANLADAVNAWLDPLGLNVGDLRDQAARAAEQNVATGTFGAMASRFDGTAGAFAYLLFILLYMPCTAAVAAIYQEAGARWALFVGLWTTGLGYGIATLYYQTATWALHPQRSTAWVAGMLSLLIGALALMRWYSQRLTIEAGWAAARP
jgi:ferrous iron transport protein B